MCYKAVNASQIIKQSGHRICMTHLFNEVVEGLSHTLEEQVVARKAASILLEQVQADGQDAAQNVCQAATQLTGRHCSSTARVTAQMSGGTKTRHNAQQVHEQGTMHSHPRTG